MTDEIPSTGGLRVITGDTIVLVDADRSGGITRLLHCWEFLTRQEGVNPTHISLFYVLVSPPNNSKEYYRSRWEFAKGRAQKECKMRLQAFLASCERPARLEPRAGLSPAIVQQTTAELRNQGMLSAFEAALAGNLGQYLGTGPVTNLETTRHEETRARIEQRSL